MLMMVKKVLKKMMTKLKVITRILVKETMKK